MTLIPGSSLFSSDDSFGMIRAYDTWFRAAATSCAFSMAHMRPISFLGPHGCVGATPRRRSGRIGLTILGAMEVSEHGDLANWIIPVCCGRRHRVHFALCWRPR